VRHYDNGADIGGFFDANFSVARNTSYNHCEIAYDGTTVRWFFGGQQKASAIVSSPRGDGTDHRWQIIGLNLQDDVDDMRMDDFQFWTTCRHTANFTPPTSEGG
jgi:hypothetical protein